MAHKTMKGHCVICFVLLSSFCSWAWCADDETLIIETTAYFGKPFDPNFDPINERIYIDDGIPTGHTISAYDGSGMRLWTKQDASIYSLRMSPDGETVAFKAPRNPDRYESDFYDGKGYIAEASTGKLIATVDESFGYEESPRFSFGGNYILDGEFITDLKGVRRRLKDVGGITWAIESPSPGLVVTEHYQIYDFSGKALGNIKELVGPKSVQSPEMIMSVFSKDGEHFIVGISTVELREVNGNYPTLHIQYHLVQWKRGKILKNIILPEDSLERGGHINECIFQDAKKGRFLWTANMGRGIIRQFDMKGRIVREFRYDPQETGTDRKPNKEGWQVWGIIERGGNIYRVDYSSTSIHRLYGMDGGLVLELPKSDSLRHELGMLYVSDSRFPDMIWGVYGREVLFGDRHYYVVLSKRDNTVRIYRGDMPSAN